jgi:hypothetical protein
MQLTHINLRGREPEFDKSHSEKYSALIVMTRSEGYNKFSKNE